MSHNVAATNSCKTTALPELAHEHKVVTYTIVVVTSTKPAISEQSCANSTASLKVQHLKEFKGDKQQRGLW